MKQKTYAIMLVLIAALGGVLYGYDLGIIGIALMYLNKCVTMSESEIGFLAAAVMIGAPLSAVVGGACSDIIGRRRTLMVAAVLFATSVVTIILSHGYTVLFLGRVLQGVSAGMIGVVVPVFMTECAPAKIRGMSATAFQLCICLGYSISMASGAWYQSGAETAIAAAGNDAVGIFSIRDHAWRMMFLTSVYPAIMFFLAAIMVDESPRWLFRHGRKEKALENLLKSRDRQQAEIEMREMTALESGAGDGKVAKGGSLLRRHYIVPLILAVTLLSINQATGINSVLPFMAIMLQQAGLTELLAGKSAMLLTTFMMIPTIFGVLLVDRLGRRRLLQIGTTMIMVALSAGMFIYWRVEAGRVDAADRVKAAITGNTLTLEVAKLTSDPNVPVQVGIQYAYGGKGDRSCMVRSDDKDPVVRLSPDSSTSNMELKILRARVSPAPARKIGWMICGCIMLYLAGFCFGPGVVLWLMSAELLPTRVRSIGMGIGVVGNAVVSATFTWMFLPIVGNYGYTVMWAIWGICTLLYFLFATFALPETSGKTLEEIEAHFAGAALGDRK